MGYRNQPTSVSGSQDVSRKVPSLQDKAAVRDASRLAESNRLAEINKKREQANWRIEQEESLYAADLQAGIRTAANKTNVDYTSLNDSMNNMVSQLSSARIRLKQSSGPYEELDPDGNVVFNTQTDKSYIKSATDFIQNSENNFGSVAYMQEEFKKLSKGNGEGEVSRKFSSPYLSLLNSASNPASGMDVNVAYDMEYDNKSGHKMGIVLTGESVRALNAEMGEEGDQYTIKPEEISNLMMGNNDPNNAGLFYINPTTVSDVEKRAVTSGIIDEQDKSITKDYMMEVGEVEQVDELTGTRQMATISQPNYLLIKQNMAASIKAKLQTTLERGQVPTSVLINTYAKQDEDGNYYYDTPRKDGNGNIIYKANGKVDFGGVNEVEYVNLSEIEGWGDGGNISNPVINANIKDGVSKMFSDNEGLTVTGATRSEELQKKLTEGGVGAKKNSRHLTGYGLDLRANAESEALLKKLNSNDGEYMKELGIKKAFFHGDGSNKHLHIGFKRGESEGDTRNRVYLGDGELQFDRSSATEQYNGLSQEDYKKVEGLIENEFMMKAGVFNQRTETPYGEKKKVEEPEAPPKPSKPTEGALKRGRNQAISDKFIREVKKGQEDNIYSGGAPDPKRIREIGGIIKDAFGGDTGDVEYDPKAKLWIIEKAARYGEDKNGNRVVESPGERITLDYDPSDPNGLSGLKQQLDTRLGIITEETLSNRSVGVGKKDELEKAEVKKLQTDNLWDGLVAKSDKATFIADDEFVSKLIELHPDIFGDKDSATDKLFIRNYRSGDGIKVYDTNEDLVLDIKFSKDDKEKLEGDIDELDKFIDKYKGSTKEEKHNDLDY